MGECALQLDCRQGKYQERLHCSVCFGNFYGHGCQTTEILTDLLSPAGLMKHEHSQLSQLQKEMRTTGLCHPVT